MEERFDLDTQWKIRLQDPWQELAARLDRPFGPAVLLRLERVHFDGHFCGSDQVGYEDEAPTAQLRPVTQVEILGEGIVLPTARFLDRRPPPRAGRAVEIEESAAAIATAMFEHEMTVEQDGLDLGQEGVIPVDVAPTRLDHADTRIRKMRQQALEKIRGRNEVGVENRDQLAPRHLQTSFDGSGFEALAVGAVGGLDVQAPRPKAGG